MLKFGPLRYDPSKKQKVDRMMNPGFKYGKILLKPSLLLFLHLIFSTTLVSTLLLCSTVVYG